MKKLFTVLLSAVVISCTSSKDFEKGKRQLENMGYTNVESTGHEMWCCGEEDTYSTGFKALDKNGYEVTGCICSGFMKGITIRFN